MSAHHTSGPWFAHTSPPSDAASVWAKADDQNVDAAPIAVCTDHERRSRSVVECQANARLIAAAPGLLEAIKLLQGMDFRLQDDDFGAEIRRRTLAAIAKAEGRS